MVSNYLNFDYEDTKDTIGGVISSALRTLDRPRGAAIAALKLQNPLEGFKNPERYQGRDVLGIQNVENETLRNILGTGVDIAFDPLNLAAAAPVGALRKAGLISGLVLPANTKVGAINRVAQNYAMGFGARAGSELATAGLEKTNLPDYVKTPLELAAGLAGGAVGGRVSAGSIKAPKLGMVEEQFEKQYSVVGEKGRLTTFNSKQEAEDFITKVKTEYPDSPNGQQNLRIEEDIVDPSWADYDNYLKIIGANDGFQIKDKQGVVRFVGKTADEANEWARVNLLDPAIHTGKWGIYPPWHYPGEIPTSASPLFDTKDEVIAWKNSPQNMYKYDVNSGEVKQDAPKAGIDYSVVKVSSLTDYIKANTLPEVDVPIGGTYAEPLIARKVQIVPANNAPMDEVLDDLHERVTGGFSRNQFTQPEAYAAKSNWISDTGNPDDTTAAGWVIRQAFKGENYVEIEGANKYHLPDEKVIYNTVEEAQKVLDVYKIFHVKDKIKIVEKSAKENFEKIAVPLYSEGEVARQELRKLEGKSPFVQNGMVYLYRGEKAFKENNLPVNENELAAESWTSNPEIAQGFTFRNYDINPYTGQQEVKAFILGKWIPVDNVVGAFGHNSGEHEYVVLNKQFISDDNWKRLTGVSKDAPLGTLTYRVYNSVDGVTAGYANNLEEAHKLAGEPKEVPVEPAGYFGIYKGDDGSITYSWFDPRNATANESWDMTPVYKDTNNAGESLNDIFYRDMVYVPFKKIEHLSNGMLQVRLNSGNVITSKNMYELERDLRNYGRTLVSPEDFLRGLDTQATTKHVEMLIEPVQRGHKPQVNIINNLDDGGLKPARVFYNEGQQLWQGVSDKVVGGVSVWGKTTDEVETKLNELGYTNDIYKETKTPGFKDKFLGMFNSNAPIAEIGGKGGGFNFKFGKLNPIDKSKLPDESLVDNVVNGTKPAKDLSYGDIPANTPSNDKLWFDAEKDLKQRLGVVDDVVDIAQPETLDKTAREQAEKFYSSRMGINTPDDELVKLFTEGFEKAGKGDPTTVGKINSILRGLWATADGSWIGIQGLMSLPRLLATGKLNDVYDNIVIPQLVLGGNKSAFGNFIKRKMATLPEGAPSLLEAQKAGLHLSILQGNPDFDMKIMERITGGIINPDMAFTAAGDIARINTFYNEWARFGKTKDLEGLARAVNRATGIAEHPFGGQIGAFALFAPRFFQSQLEIIGKSITDGGIEGSIARREVLSLIGTGVSLTLAANYVRGYTDPDVFDPSSSNFMRIRNVMGQDVSIFGPWDSLIKLTMHMASGDIGYARTKASPIISVVSNILTGETFTGESYKDPKVVAKSLLLPFAWQRVGEESIPATAMSFFGVKSSPQSPGEIIESNMKNLGLDPDDPLQRREYLAENPVQRKYFDKADKQASEVTQDIKARSYMNDLKTMNDEIKLIQFRDNRTILQREQRNKLDVILKDSDFKADTEKRKWIQSYFDLYSDARDPITQDVNGPKLDELQAKWIADNGPQAFEYLQNYLLVGKNPVELKYLQDMNKLRQLGYFDTPKYLPSVYSMSNNLTDDQIESYRNKVSAARATNELLSRLPFSTALRMVLGNELSSGQLMALDLAGKDAFVNPQVTTLKKQYPGLFIWFNPNATWSMKTNVEKNTPPTIPTIAQVSNLQPVGNGTR